MSQHSEDLAAERDLIYDWNAQEKVGSLSPKRKVTFLDETLRDGIQSPSVVDPTIDDGIVSCRPCRLRRPTSRRRRAPRPCRR